MNRKIDEWARHSFAGPYSQQTIIYFILFLNVIGFCFFLFRRDKQKLKEIIASPFTLLLLMGLQSVRNSALAFYVLIPFACEFLLKKGRRKEYREHHSTLNLILSLIIFAIGIAFLPTIKPSVSEFLPANKREVFSRSTPVIFAHFLNETADTSPVFNDWDYGSYLMLEQKHPIFIDTRNIIYSDESFKEFSDVCLAEANWSLILEKYKVKYVLLEKKQRTKLINQLLAAGWKIVLMNDETVLFEKRA
jgi:hypothetical protein